MFFFSVKVTRLPFYQQWLKHKEHFVENNPNILCKTNWGMVWNKWLKNMKIFFGGTKEIKWWWNSCSHVLYTKQNYFLAWKISSLKCLCLTYLSPSGFEYPWLDSISDIFRYYNFIFTGNSKKLVETIVKVLLSVVWETAMSFLWNILYCELLCSPSSHPHYD